MKTNLVHGKGAMQQLPGVIGEYRAKRVFLVTDKGLIDGGVCDLVTKVLDAAGLTYTVYSDVKANPPDEIIEKGLQVAKEFEPDVLVALGGGSSIDTAKGINILLTTGGTFATMRDPIKFSSRRCLLSPFPPPAAAAARLPGPPLSPIPKNTLNTPS